MVKSDGTIWSINLGRNLKPWYNEKGYRKVRLGSKEYRVARLIALAFIPNPNRLPEVDHIDEIRDNDNVSNLQWISHQQNVERSQGKLCKLISPKGEIVNVKNLTRFARDNDLQQSHITNVSNGKRKSHKGWKLCMDG